MSYRGEELVFFEASADWLVEVRGAPRIVGGRLRLTGGDRAGLAFSPADPTVAAVYAPLEMLGPVAIDGISSLRVDRRDAAALSFVLAQPLALASALEQAHRWRADRPIYR